MIIAVIDGMGGGVGGQIVSRLREELPSSVEIYALGTNAIATAAMMKQKANKGATGENAIFVSSKKANVIVAPFSIMVPDSMMGEITHRMVQGVSESEALKVILPLMPENYNLAGIESKPLILIIEDAVNFIKKEFNFK